MDKKVFITTVSAKIFGIRHDLLGVTYIYNRTNQNVYVIDSGCIRTFPIQMKETGSCVVVCLKLQGFTSDKRIMDRNNMRWKLSYFSVKTFVIEWNRITFPNKMKLVAFHNKIIQNVTILSSYFLYQTFLYY